MESARVVHGSRVQGLHSLLLHLVELYKDLDASGGVSGVDLLSQSVSVGRFCRTSISFFQTVTCLSTASSNMRFTASALAIGAVASLAAAVANPDFFSFPDIVPMAKRQTSGPAYQCHASCGQYTAVGAQ